VAVTSPTMRQRELGRRLRDLRTQRDLTVEDVGERLLCSATKISRLETGARPPSLRDVRDLCALYEVDTANSAELMSLARGAREQTWWTQYNDLKLDPYLGFEQDAVAITSYTTYVFPALLQTEDYARAVIKTIAPKMDPEIFQQRVEVRMLRQQVLEKAAAPRYRVLLDEAVLHRRVGGPSVMAAQLDKVLKSARDKATIQVIRFGVGALAAQDSNFILFEFDDGSSTVFVEGLAGNNYHERKADVTRYRENIDSLRDSALSPKDSIEYIEQVRNKSPQD
jgi:transcriptional regulator with XRE-family HTH domain